MTAKHLFNIVLKLLGIYFIKEILVALPSFLGLLLSLIDNDIGSEGMMLTSVLYLISVAMYCIVVYILVFNTDLVIEKLKLTKDFPEEPLALNIHRSTVLNIAILFTGLYVIVQAIPDVVRDVIQFFQYRESRRGILGASEPYNYSWFVAHIAEMLIGFILVAYQKGIVNFIEYRRTK